MSVRIPIDNTQPENKMTAVADEQRRKIKAINDYLDQNQYTSTNPDALADGDNMGRGTGQFLDVTNYNAGTSEDILKRREAFAGAKYKPISQYTKPTS
jgi:hypothetical protein